MVASYDHHIESTPEITVVQVDRSDQAVDLYISNHIHPGDLLVTQDFGLAAIGLAKGAITISVRGQLLTDEMIDFLLASRHMSAKRRRSGQRVKGPRALSQRDRESFRQMLSKVLHSLQEKQQM